MRRPAAGGDELTLDPADSAELRLLGHRMLDDMFAYLDSVRDRPAWQPLPREVKERLRQGIPHEGRGAAAAYREFVESVLPYPTGNIHPRFWGWVTGTGSHLGMLAEMLAGGMNSMVAASEHAPAHVEAQVLDWFKELFGFPKSASGLFVSGASMANLVALTAARNARAAGEEGLDLFRSGVRSLRGAPVLYASDQAHASVEKAAAILGLGADCVRRVETDHEFRMRSDLLDQAIRNDLEAGANPVCVVGSAGTVTTGAVDDLAALAEICTRYGIWFHIDGAFGALAVISPSLRESLAGIDRADSLAFDLHKWMYMPYEAGAVLVRDRNAHRAAFTAPAAYLATAPRGIAAAEHAFNEYGVELSRGFKALKVWLSLQADGLDRYARLIEQNVEQARYLAGLVQAHPALELLAPVPLNIVCLRYTGAIERENVDAANAEILMRLQERGLAVPTAARVRGAFAIRCAITNHRSRREDFAALVDAVAAIGREVEREAGRGIAAPGQTLAEHPSSPPTEEAQ